MNIFRTLGSKIIPLISWIKWDPIKALFNDGKYWTLDDSDWAYLQYALSEQYYVILTRNDTHLSTYLVELGNLITTGKFGHWSHALMNLEGDDPKTKADFKLMEATGPGVHYSTFEEVFRCDSVALLKPAALTHAEWTEIMDRLLDQEGKEYDNLFDLANDSKLSCVELVRVALMALPDYAVKFAHLEKMIAEYGNLTPEMFYECPDFEVVWEVRRSN
jgi:hypothetical protein